MGKLYFVRHGETVWNVENKICGATDSPLTEKGHKQAIQTGQRLKEMGVHVDQIICSPLSRAEDTARHIAEMMDVPCQVEERLREQNFGKYESTARDGREFYEAKKSFTYRFDGGESMFQMAQRIYNVLDEVKADSERTYLIVAHNGIARIVQSYFYEMTNDEFSDYGIDNCTVNVYEF